MKDYDSWNPLPWSEYMDEIQEVVIETGVTNIGNRAFYNCSNLTSVDIPNSVSSIGENAFYGCRSITSIIIPNSVTSIGESAFNGCENLASIIIPNSVSHVGKEAFNGTAWLSSQPSGVIYVGKVAYIYLWPENWTDLSEIEVNIKDGTTEIADEAFWSVTFMGKVTIPNSVKSIGRYAFDGCNNLKSIEISNGVISIGDGAFIYCYNLNSIEIPNSVISIGGDAFYRTAWYNNQPNGLVYAGKVAYRYKGTMPQNAEIVINEGTLSIANCAFSECGSFSVVIPNSLTHIGSSAFSNSGVKSVTIPNSVTYIGDGAFRDCSVLNSVTLPTNITTIESSTFEGCSGLTSVYIPENVTSIGEFSFGSCSSLTSVTIPNSVTTIENYAFYECIGLTSITIPSSVTFIGKGVFKGSYISTIISQIYDPFPITSDVFADINGNPNYSAALYVPYGTKSKYEATECWNKLRSIKEINKIDIGSSGKSSFCSLADLDFTSLSGLKAYIVTGYEADTKTVWLTRVNSVPAYTPVMVEGSEGEYEVPLAPSFAYLPTNLLKCNVSGDAIQIESEGEGYANYLLSGGTFHPVASTGGTVADGKCYLQLPTNLSPKAEGAAVNVTIAASGKSSFCAPVDLDFTNVSGLKAYTATGYDKNGTIWMSRVKKVSKGTALMLEGTGSNAYTIPSEGVQTSYVNMFVGNISGAEISINSTDGDLTNFLLKDGKFHPVASTGGRVGNNKSYLQLPTSYLQLSNSNSAPRYTNRSANMENQEECQENETKAISIVSNLSIDKEDGTTGIHEHSTANDLKNNEKWFNLQGQHVTNPVKGLYIKGGKKMILH
jgi:hypothetical protein